MPKEVTEKSWLPSKGAGWVLASISRGAQRPAKMRRESVGRRRASSSGMARPARFSGSSPKNEITAVLFTQMRPFDKVHLHKTFRDAVYRNDPVALAH
jgi:hypothetical protein